MEGTRIPLRGQHNPAWLASPNHPTYVFFYFKGRSLTCATQSNTSRQIKEISRSVGYTARPSGGSCFSMASDMYGPT